MQNEEIIRAFRAIELLFKDIDVSKMKREDLSKIDKSESDTFIMAIDDKLKEFLEVFNSYVLRDKKVYSLINEEYLKKIEGKVSLTVSFDNYIDTLRLLKAAGIDAYPDIDECLLNPDFKKHMDEIDASFDYSQSVDCPLKSLNPLEELKALLALSQYPNGLGKEIYEYANKEHKFVLEAFKDFKVTNNRIFIPLSEADRCRLKHFLVERKQTDKLSMYSEMKAIVISKNPIDYFYCSYGNAFQSCFALSSNYKCWYGFVPFVTADESFIVYGTTGDVMKTSVISGTKFHSPNMLWRAWGYADENKNLLLDKKYRNSNYNLLIEFCCKFLKDKFNAICDGPHSSDERRSLFNGGKGLYRIFREELKFYSDSLIADNRRNKVDFKYGCGINIDAEYTPEWMRDYSDFLTYAKSCSSIGTINLDNPSVIVNGVLFTPKRCPITGLNIPEEKSKHEYSKYFSSPVSSLAVITYINGGILLDSLASSSREITTSHFGIRGASTDRNAFSEGCLYLYKGINSSVSMPSLKSLKEHLKGYIKETSLDAILLRVVEDDKVTIQVFKR